MVSYTPISLHCKKCGHILLRNYFSAYVASLSQREANVTVKQIKW